MRFDNRSNPASRIKLSYDGCFHGLTGRNHILEDAIDGVLVEYSQVPVGQKIHLQGLKLHTRFFGDVTDGDSPNIRKSGLRTDGSELRNLDLYLIVGKLIRKNLDVREFILQARLGFLF